MDAPYDFDMVMSDDERLYCSELIYHALKSININIDKRTPRMGRKIVTPNDLFTYFISAAMTNNEFIYRGCLSKKDYVVIEHHI